MLSRIGFRMLVGLLDQLVVPDLPAGTWKSGVDLGQLGVVRDWLKDQDEWVLVEGLDWVLQDLDRLPRLYENRWEVHHHVKEKLEDGCVYDNRWVTRTHTKPGALLAWVLVRYKALRDELLLLETVHEPH